MVIWVAILSWVDQFTKMMSNFWRAVYSHYVCNYALQWVHVFTLYKHICPAVGTFIHAMWATMPCSEYMYPCHVSDYAFWWVHVFTLCEQICLAVSTCINAMWATMPCSEYMYPYYVSKYVFQCVHISQRTHIRTLRSVKNEMLLSRISLKVEDAFPLKFHLNLPLGILLTICQHCFSYEWHGTACVFSVSYKSIQMPFEYTGAAMRNKYCSGFTAGRLSQVCICHYGNCFIDFLSSFPYLIYLRDKARGTQRKRWNGVDLAPIARAKYVVRQQRRE